MLSLYIFSQFSALSADASTPETEVTCGIRRVCTSTSFHSLFLQFVEGKIKNEAGRRSPPRSSWQFPNLRSHSRHMYVLYTAMPDKRSSDSDWRLLLSPFEYKVLREKGTEPRGGEYDQFFPEPTEGYFICRGCARPLYSAAAKFKSSCGWPAFDKCYKVKAPRLLLLAAAASPAHAHESCSTATCNFLHPDCCCSCCCSGCGRDDRG